MNTRHARSLAELATSDGYRSADQCREAWAARRRAERRSSIRWGLTFAAMWAGLAVALVTHL